MRASFVKYIHIPDDGQVNGQPAAVNMREMVWDEELARVAQR
jgi:hypothetical protein